MDSAMNEHDELRKEELADTTASLADTVSTQPTVDAAERADEAGLDAPSAADASDATVDLGETQMMDAVDAASDIPVPDASADATIPTTVPGTTSDQADVLVTTSETTPKTEPVQPHVPLNIPDPSVAPAEDIFAGLEKTIDDDAWQHASSDDVFSDTSGFDDVSAFSSTPIDEGFEGYQEGQVLNARESHMGRRVAITILIVLLVLGGIYAGIALYFSSHFLPNTKVNGEEVSGMSVADLANHVTQIGSNYATHVSGDGIDLTVSAGDIDLKYDGQSYGAEAQAQIPAWAWIVELTRPHEYTVSQGIAYDEVKLDTILNNHVAAVNEKGSDPINANMAYDPEEKQFAPVSESLGTKVELQTVIDTVSRGISTLKDEITLGDNELVQPTITTSDPRIVACVDQANSLLKSNISLQIDGKSVMGIETDLLASWFTLDPDCNFVAAPETIRVWTEGTLSEFMDTCGKSRTFTRADGKVIEVNGGEGDSTYGWMIDGAGLANLLSDHLQKNNTEPIEIPMKRKASVWAAKGERDWPNRYIDVDLSDQYVRMYGDNNEIIWEAPCVSGNPIYGGGTDTGVYYIYDKESPMVLIGLDYNGDGEPDYRTDVTYWMPFDGGEGLHDADWRGAFGDSIYTYDGSHGCVNLPYYSAQELYSITNVGDVVVVHW